MRGEPPRVSSSRGGPPRGQTSSHRRQVGAEGGRLLSDGGGGDAGSARPARRRPPATGLECAPNQRKQSKPDSQTSLHNMTPGRFPVEPLFIAGEVLGNPVA